MDIREIIDRAKQHLDDDPHLANFMLRDTLEIRQAGLDDLSWAMHKAGCSKNDVLYLMGCLEKWLANPKGGDDAFSKNL